MEVTRIPRPSGFFHFPISNRDALRAGIRDDLFHFLRHDNLLTKKAISVGEGEAEAITPDDKGGRT